LPSQTGMFWLFFIQFLIYRVPNWAPVELLLCFVIRVIFFLYTRYDTYSGRKSTWYPPRWQWEEVEHDDSPHQHLVFFHGLFKLRDYLNVTT
jgi:hypothetical protein